MMFESGSTQLIINGYLSDRFHPGGGGKQGDPLYPLLFLVVMLGLIAIIDHDESIKGIPLPLCDRSIKIECFADDTSLFIGHHDDYHKYRSHITLFERASTMRTNWSKTIGMLLGHYAEHAPDYAINSDMEWITYKEPTRVLGIMVGPSNRPSINWAKALSKVRSFISHSNPSFLTINGRIIIANSCKIGCAFLYM